MSREINSGKQRDKIEPAPAEIVSTARDKTLAIGRESRLGHDESPAAGRVNVNDSQLFQCCDPLI